MAVAVVVAAASTDLVLEVRVTLQWSQSEIISSVTPRKRRQSRSLCSLCVVVTFSLEATTATDFDV